MDGSGYVAPPEGQTDRERDDLAALLASPGWRYLCEYVASQWNDTATVLRIEALVSTAVVGDQKETAGQVCAAKRAVEAVMTWPKNRVHVLSTPRMVARPERRRRA